MKSVKNVFEDSQDKVVAIFKFTGLIRFKIIGQLTAFYSLSDETEVLSLYDLSCWCDGNHEHLNHRHATKCMFMSNQLVDRFAHSSIKICFYKIHPSCAAFAFIYIRNH